MVDYLKDAPDEIAKMLFKLGAVKVNLSNYYRLGSGDFSPLYVDARQLLSGCPLSCFFPDFVLGE